MAEDDPLPEKSDSDNGAEEEVISSLSIEPGEEVAGLEDDGVAPLGAYRSVPVVGLGGSAGSIPFLQTFFAQTAPDTGVAYVVVVHLSPEHESTLAAVLQHSTAMPVLQVNERMAVEANKVYVIPPAKKLSMVDGQISIVDLDPTPGRRVAVDLFLRSLANTHGPRACAIILSGADSDGAIGIKRIKERGGLTVVQNPEESPFDTMPRAAIATGMIDWILPVREMPARLATYRETEKQIQLSIGPGTPDTPPVPGADAERYLQQVLSLLRISTGRDFSYYKRPTVLRRIFRRMQVNGLTELPAYVSYLRAHPGETGALLQDLLISVTNFYRDPASFAALEEMMPRIFQNKGMGDHVRVWVAGCATGEEAYSIAILLSEYAARLTSPPHLQVFATDIDEQAIRAGREGSYPETITADLSEERLRQFFVKEHGHYRVKAQLRSIVLFAVHDLLSDPPFSRVDLVSCRNLLIYLNRRAQNKAFDIFHFALRDEGLLFLGSSESIEENGSLFRAIAKPHRLYLRRALARAGHPIFSGRSTLPFEPKRLPRLYPVPMPPASQPERPPEAALTSAAPRGREVSWVELHFRLLTQVSPPSLIIDQDQNIVHLSENAGRFLQFGGGEPTMNLLRVVNPTLRLDLRAAIFRASQNHTPVDLLNQPFEIEGETKLVDVSIFPATEVAPDFLMVLFREKPPEPGREPPPPPARNSAMIELEKELDHVKNQLRDTVDQYEAGSEELKASNEELQAMNEELRSTTEELETSREELQSINEELSTVNQELKGKVEEVSRSNSDLQNLMFSINIATIFLDRELQIKRYTPASVELFNLIPTDLGRPLSDLTPKLEYSDISTDARHVLEQLTPIERETRSLDGRYFLVRLLPYRTSEDQIGGVVLTFVDITRRREVEERLKVALEKNEVARADIEAAAAAKDNFLAMLSHELRTPLTPVLMTVDTLMRRADLTGRVRSGLEMIRRNVEIESRFIDDLLDLTRIARAKFEILRQPVNLHQVIRDAVEITKPDRAGRRQKLTVNLDAAECGMVGDATRLQQVIWNLLKNASKFTADGGKIRIATSNPEKGKIQVVVTDNGIGMEPKALSLIFDPFSQGGVDVTREYGGLGLGLAISKAAIEAHGGTIAAQSSGKNQGSTFILSLPVSAS